MTHTDIKHEGWISKLPMTWRPYAILMRLDRPIGWWLLLLPGWWSIILGAGQLEEATGDAIRFMIYFFIGAVLMRGAGCVINDLWDRDLDKQVERTKSRPIASGQINLFQASAFLFSLLFVAFIILLQTSGMAILLGFLSLIFIVAYPYMKRITWWPQAFLGLTFNLGALMGWAAMTHGLERAPLILYIGCFFWTMGYDTIYAHQDKEDDALVGIKSTARLFGDHSKIWIACFYSAAMTLIALAAYSAGVPIFALVILAIPAFFLFHQLIVWDMGDPESSLEVFKSNRNFGLMVAACFVAFTIIPHIGFLNAVLQ